MTGFESNAEVEPCVTTVMPIFNEIATVASVVKCVLAQRVVRELIVVDDYSQNGTWETLRTIVRTDSRVRLLRCNTNQGKGAAVRRGVLQSTSEIIIVQDADSEYDPHDYYRLIGPIYFGKAAVVFGSRFIEAALRRKLPFSPSDCESTRINHSVEDVATALNLTDMETGFKGISPWHTSTS